MREAVAAMRNTDLSIAAIVSAGELFCRFITLSLDDKHMEECRQIMLNRGKIFLTKLQNSRQVISQQAQRFISDGCRILTHSRSRVVLKALIAASQNKKTFHVFVTQGGIGNSGQVLIGERIYLYLILFHFLGRRWCRICRQLALIAHLYWTRRRAMLWNRLTLSWLALRRSLRAAALSIGSALIQWACVRAK